ncbi:PD-(D/E)XK nuclease domain-containing protein [Candidatus Albibeggiatoa sp. nov. BB20]|uniref:PD-(D/E)XK nuclease domain-containing protein n=1 Tax=Candidatus Albibeggiatoa sp. nov. BB20 TaxID=3162723 RepID=UPI003365302E
MLLPEYEDKEGIRKATEHFYHSDNLQPLCDFIENRYFQVFDNRDYKWSNELVIKSTFLTLLFSDTFYIMDSEQELNKGYADLSLIVRPDMRQYQLLDHVIEFKYLKLDTINMTGKQVRETPRETLAQLSAVQKALVEAETQLHYYRTVLTECHRLELRLHTYAVVALSDWCLWKSSAIFSII